MNQATADMIDEALAAARAKSAAKVKWHVENCDRGVRDCDICNDYYRQQGMPDDYNTGGV